MRQDTKAMTTGIFSEVPSFDDGAACLAPLEWCETAPKWELSKNRFTPLISNHQRNFRGVPIGADWYPC